MIEAMDAKLKVFGSLMLSSNGVCSRMMRASLIDAVDSRLSGDARWRDLEVHRAAARGIRSLGDE
jgi:hypothetical protein